MRVEWRRELPVDGDGHGNVHLILHEPGTKRTETAICGVDTSGMRKQTTPFRGWTQVVCPECYERLEV